MECLFCVFLGHDVVNLSFIFNFYGPALLSSTEDAFAEAYVFALPVGQLFRRRVVSALAREFLSRFCFWGPDARRAGVALCGLPPRGSSAVVGAWLRSAMAFSSDGVVSAMESAGSALLVASSPP